MTKSCAHMNFFAHVEVVRLEDTSQFMADVKVRCSECDLPFQFLGLECGLDMQGSTVSIDGLTARMAISPQGGKPSPLQRMGFGVEKFDA